MLNMTVRNTAKLIRDLTIGSQKRDLTKATELEIQEVGPSHLGLRTTALEKFAKKDTQIKATAVQATAPVKS